MLLSNQNIFLGCGNSEISKRTFIKLNENIEKMSKWLHFIVGKLSIAGLLLPTLLITIVKYFILDFGDESFFLPTPILYVNSRTYT